MYMGGGPSECSGAGGYARNGLLAQVCPQNVVLLQNKGGAVHIRAARARICSSVGNSPAFDGKEDSERKWHVALDLFLIISDR
jgi:hypothetical protein